MVILNHWGMYCVSAADMSKSSCTIPVCTLQNKAYCLSVNWHIQCGYYSVSGSPYCDHISLYTVDTLHVSGIVCHFPCVNHGNISLCRYCARRGQRWSRMCMATSWSSGSWPLARSSRFTHWRKRELLQKFYPERWFYLCICSFLMWTTQYWYLNQCTESPPFSRK